MMRTAVGLIAACSVVIVLDAQQTPPKTAVFVGPQVRGGFADIDRGIRDSIRDLKEELQFAGFRVASKPEDAAQSSLMNSDAAVGGESSPDCSHVVAGRELRMSKSQQ